VGLRRRGRAHRTRADRDPRAHLPDSADGLPFRYYFVGPDGSFAYRRLETADMDEPQMDLQKGFAVAVVSEQASGGARYGRTPHDLWIPMRDLAPVRNFAFQGEVFPPRPRSGRDPGGLDHR
jgi:hypothetical protein